MSQGPYRVITDDACGMFRIEGPAGLIGYGFLSMEVVNQRVEQLNAAYTAGREAQKRESDSPLPHTPEPERKESL